MLSESKRILNVDESWIGESSFIRRMWCPPKSPATVTSRIVTPRLSLIAAIDTDGRVWYSLTQANTDQNVMLVYLQHLVAVLDAEIPGWKADTYLLLDGARYHVGSEIREYLHKMQVLVCWSAPYSYASASIELIFSALKFGTLN